MIGHVFKYPINFPNEAGKVIELNLPNNFAICDINHQDDCIFLWAMVDIHAPLEPYQFVVHGTGWKIDDVENLFFLKTVHMPNGLVWHVFAVQELQK